MYIQNVHDQISIILLWIDDILIASKTEAHLVQVKTRLILRFKMTDLGQLTWFLRIQFECENNTIRMNQSRYIEKIWSKFGMDDCKPQAPKGDQGWIIEIIGSLIYIMVATRPDICYTVLGFSRTYKIEFFPWQNTSYII